MSLWQRLNLSSKTLFFLKLFFVSLIIHVIAIFFLLRHCFEAPLSLVFQFNTNSSVKYVPLIASDKKIAELNAKNKKHALGAEGRKKITKKTDTVSESAENIVSSFDQKIISHSVVHEGMIKRAIKKATSIVIEKQKKYKKEKRNTDKKKENIKKYKKEQQKKIDSTKTKKAEKDAADKKNKVKSLQQEKKEVVEIAKEKEQKNGVVETSQLIHTEKITVKNQEDGVAVTGDETIMYVSYKEYDAVVAGAAFVDSMKDKWIAPVGMPKNSFCEVLITIDAKGSLVALLIERSSNVLVYDASVKDTLSSMEFPKEVYGKTLRVSFKS